MAIKKVSSVIFSATGSTKKVISILTGEFQTSSEEYDITNYTENEKEIAFGSDELIIFGIPVYGGRVPVTAANRIRNIKGAKTPAVLIAVYGNRDYDDALMELKDIVERNGFVTIGAAAFIAEHSIMNSVAPGRPDEDDKKIIRSFARQVWNKAFSEAVEDCERLEIKGNWPYREYSGVPFKPLVTKECAGCGICAANCPVQAIPKDDPKLTYEELCISCMRCIKLCPSNARKLNETMLASAEQSFAKLNSRRKEPDIFIKCGQFATSTGRLSI